MAAHPLATQFVAISTVAGATIFLAIGSAVLALAWIAIILAFVVGDITTLFKYARCKYCGFVVAPAPSWNTQCPKCKEYLRGSEHAL